MDIRDTQDKVELNNKQIAIDFGNPAGTADKLNDHLPEIADKYEVKLEQHTNGTPYKALPHPNTGDKITVEALTGGTYKGYRHHVDNGTMTINYISIYNEPIKGVTDVEDGAGFQVTTDKGGLFVYYESNISKPLLICLSQDGKAGGSEKNKWYKRTMNGSSGYTWSTPNENYSTRDPNRIDTFEEKLGKIQGYLESPPGGTDKGYSNPADRNDNLTLEGTASGIEIQINQTNDYKSGAGGSETVRVFLKNYNPIFPYTCYTHKVQGATNKYKKIGTATLKNGDANLTKPKAGEPSKRDPIQESDVHYVHVYYFGDRPILICVKKYDSAGGGNEYKYYEPDYKLYNPYAVIAKWKEETTISGAPENNDKLKTELDSLTLPLTGMLFRIKLPFLLILPINSINYNSILLGTLDNRGYGTKKYVQGDTDDQTIEAGNKGILKLFSPYAKGDNDKGNADLVSHIWDWFPILMLAASLGFQTSHIL